MNMKKLLIFFTLLFVLTLSGLVEAGDNIGKAAYIRGLDKDSTGSITQNLSMVGAVILGALNADLTKPGFGFLNDPDTGMGQDSANSISFITAGNWRMYLSTVGLLINLPVTFSNTVQAVINFSGDTTTGFGRKSAGKPNVWSSNVEVFFWDSLGAYLASTTASSSDFAVLSRKEINSLVSSASLTFLGTTSANIAGTTPSEGTSYWDLTSHKAVSYNGSEWMSLGSKIVFAETWADDNATATDIVTQDVYVNVASGVDGAQIATAGVKCTGTGYVTINATNSFTIGANGSGTYKIMFNVSFSGSANDTYEFHTFKNETMMPNVGIERKLGAGGDIGAVSGQGYLNLQPNDHISLRVVNHTTTGDCTVRMMNFSVLRVNQKDY